MVVGPGRHLLLGKLRRSSTSLRIWIRDINFPFFFIFLVIYSISVCFFFCVQNNVELNWLNVERLEILKHARARLVSRDWPMALPVPNSDGFNVFCLPLIGIMIELKLIFGIIFALFGGKFLVGIGSNGLSFLKCIEFTGLAMALTFLADLRRPQVPGLMISMP